ncbi:CRIB domain-containing protein RIC10 isoform X1 [Zea mays]|uniref:CRIB domain-containing protein RIC10 isoform X1 n=1 Tax=Zea mays TaxID=4577 RepID=UPI0004DEBE35|nr:CRIB domain-containing protein RIC10 isoform X1 [Zea mays]|eukprot:XP_008657778.1 CRIB domain-containing protein RIC10 isoform X2 [Zea mays]
MACKVKGIFKGLKAFSWIFAVKEHEMEIGCPTDVKHVAHIGWDSVAGGVSPSWMNDIMASSDLSSLGNFAALTGTSWVSQVHLY